MKALVFTEKSSFPNLQEFDDSLNRYDEEVEEVELLASGMNRRDYYITQGLYPAIVPDTILGSDAVGKWEDKRVILNPNVNWGDNNRYQSKEYEVLGMPKHGTFSEKIVVPRHRIHEAPQHLTDIEAATLPLAGMTAWRAITTKGEVSEGDKVLISGVGGGVAQLALKYAVKLKAEVYVTSGKQEKIDKAVNMGAEAGVKYTDENWGEQLKELSSGIDVVIDSAGGEGFKNFIPLCNPGGRIVFYGGTRGKITEINPQIMFWRQLSIHGTTMASDAEFVEMLSFVSQHKIRPEVDRVFSLRESEKAFELLGSGEPFGKIAFDHGS